VNGFILDFHLQRWCFLCGTDHHVRYGVMGCYGLFSDTEGGSDGPCEVSILLALHRAR
jgi:hypothetical protein